MPRAARWVVLAAAALYAAVLSVVSVLRLVGFVAEHDLGAYSQYVWKMGQLQEPFGTIALRSMLEDHFEPTFALLAPLGTFGIQAPGLLVVQATAIAAVAPLLLILARQSGATGWLAAVPALLWLASPAVVKANLFDYHPDTLIPVLLIGSLVALNSGRLWLFAVLAALATGVKEDAGLTIAALGIALAWNGRRRLGLTVAGLAGAWVLAVNGVVLPRMNSIVRDNFTSYFVGDRGEGISGFLRYAVLHPVDTVGSTFSLEKLGILVILLATTGGLCLLAARWMIVALPLTTINLLSAYDPQSTLNYHYWLVPAAGLALAGAIGVSRVPADLRVGWGRGAVATGVLLLALSVGGLSEAVQEVRAAWPKRADRQAIVDAVPNGASVGLQQYLFAALAGREWMFALPEPFVAVQPATEWGARERRAAIADLDAVILDRAIPSRLAPVLERHGFRPALRRGDLTLYLRARDAPPEMVDR